MELTNEFRVGVPVAQAWEVLTDVERIAPCMPGAELQEIEGDEYRGVVKVKVGPITAQYKGKASFVEKDDATHRAVLRAEGRETRGQGNASATITAALNEDGDGTNVAITTDLTVTGRVAQFGRGVLADVSAKLLTQFVDCLETSVLGAGAAAAADAGTGHAGATTAASSAAASASEVPPVSEGPRRVDQGPVEPVDLLETAGTPIAKRVGPILAAIAVLWLIRLFLKRRKRVTRVHHVNVVVPGGASDDVAGWYEAVLGAHRIDRPDTGRDGVWLCFDGGGELHLSERVGVAHPDQHFAVVVDDVAAARTTAERLGSSWEHRHHDRGFTTDPAGNRVEILGHEDAAR